MHTTVAMQHNKRKCESGFAVVCGLSHSTHITIAHYCAYFLYSRNATAPIAAAVTSSGLQSRDERRGMSSTHLQIARRCALACLHTPLENMSHL